MQSCLILNNIGFTIQNGYFCMVKTDEMELEIKIRALPPVWFIRLINNFRYSLMQLSKRLFPANVVLYEHFQFFWLLPCMKVAAELNIANLIKTEPKTVEQLAIETDTNRESLFRLIRALASRNIFKLKKDGLVYNTPMSKALTDDHGSLRFMIMQHLGTLNWTVFSQLSHSIKTGEDAFSKVYGKKIYDYLAEKPKEADLFDRSMTNLSEISIEPILSAYNFSKFNTLADIGGGAGLLLSSILFKHKKLKGILFDLPSVVLQAKSIILKYGVVDRIAIKTGTFFDPLPAAADGYLLKNVIHNWSDEECIRILSNISAVLPDHGKILILEMIVQEDNKPSFAKLIDIQMMVFMHSGKERTKKEFQQLLSRSGLRINRIVPTISPLSIIEAVKGG